MVNHHNPLSQSESLPAVEEKNLKSDFVLTEDTHEQMETMVNMGPTSQRMYSQLLQFASNALNTDPSIDLTAKAHWMRAYGKQYQILSRLLDEAKTFDTEHCINPFKQNTGFNQIMSFERIMEEIPNSRGLYGKFPATGNKGTEAGKKQLETHFELARNTVIDMPDIFRRSKGVIGALNKMDAPMPSK